MDQKIQIEWDKMFEIIKAMVENAEILEKENKFIGFKKIKINNYPILEEVRIDEIRGEEIDYVLIAKSGEKIYVIPSHNLRMNDSVSQNNFCIKILTLFLRGK